MPDPRPSVNAQGTPSGSWETKKCGPEVDIQLWIEEGDRPLPRKFMFTSKWEGGSPRFVANLSWDTKPTFEPDFFEFKAPEGATKIRFTTQQ